MVSALLPKASAVALTEFSQCYCFFLTSTSILGSLHLTVVLEEAEAGFAINLGHVIAQFVAATEDLVELVVAEADDFVVGYRATVIYLADVCPHAGTQAHVTGFACGVEFATREVEGAQALACLADGIYLTMTGGVVVGQHMIVTRGDEHSVTHDGCAERSAIAIADPLASLLDGYLHELTLCLYHLLELGGAVFQRRGLWD